VVCGMCCSELMFCDIVNTFYVHSQFYKGVCMFSIAILDRIFL
jgi:hypothetical protein